MAWIAAAATVAGAYIASSGSKSAANTQASATRDANATQKYIYDETRKDNQPALDARNWSLQELQRLLSPGGSLSGPISVGDVTQDPGYQFGMQQGQQALARQMNARGMYNSGAAMKSAARYGTDYATTKYDNAFQRESLNRNAQLNPLQAMAGMGQSGANSIAGAGQNYANGVSNNLTSLGNAQGAAQLAGANSWGNALNQLGGWYNNMNSGSQLSGFNGNAMTGYTNQQPWTVGPV
jgi:hypothetical protein